MAITNLTNTKWEVSSGWSCVSNYGRFNINYILDDTNACVEMIFGYNPFSGEGKANYIFATGDMSNSNNTNAELTSTTSFVINIIDGTDVTNTKLISWLETYGEQIVEEQVKPTEYTLRIDGVEVTDYENVIVNGVSYKCKKGASVPTDLTGYTVTVPSGWTVTSGYGRFSIIGFASWNGEHSINMQGFGVGVNKSWIDSSTNCAITTNFSSPDNTNTTSRLNSDYISFSITGGTDVTNPRLIEWFVDMGATFTKSKLITFTIDGTSYSAEKGMTWGEWIDSSYNTDKYNKHPNLPDAVRKKNEEYNVCYIDESGVSLTDAITASYSYITIFFPSGGGSN